jgi:hypothetical protein
MRQKQEKKKADAAAAAAGKWGVRSGPPGAEAPGVHHVERCPRSPSCAPLDNDALVFLYFNQNVTDFSVPLA